jgi:hypothetical protein
MLDGRLDYAQPRAKPSRWILNRNRLGGGIVCLVIGAALVIFASVLGLGHTTAIFILPGLALLLVGYAVTRNAGDERVE